ncbi:MAG: hypothetical protein KGD60_01295 [Candidatus Thorarchaeota archaeon]|nr:hypothetical protein [Candidatus Thorarchaeota archaeon]
MGSVWFSKKAFLYFGGAAIILIGGAVVLSAPYHYINFAVTESQQRTFDVRDEQGYYPHLEISVSLRPGNSSTVDIGLVLEENSTLDTFIINMTLDQDNMVETSDSIFYEGSILVDIPVGNYTVTIDQINGAGLIDLGLNQVSDSKLFIFIGGSMNFIGLIMGISGYFVAGTLLPTDSDTIVEWGFDGEKDNESHLGN